MMTFKNRLGQIVKLAATSPTGIALSMRLMRVLPAFNYIRSATGGTLNARGPTQLTNNFIAFRIINQGLDVNEH
jgi:hypothetical protein